jgi:PHD/YefM family antitoxin component YafN of YafNO toxin-antitoxin module
MNILSEAIVSNSEMIKNYKASRDIAESLGKIFIFKNNQPDAVLFSIKEYERIAVLIEYLDSLEEQELTKIISSIPMKKD